MNLSTAKDRLDAAIQKLPIPDMTKVDHDQAVEDFACVVVRDALQECGVPFAAAEQLATTRKGGALKRLTACVREINKGHPKYGHPDPA